MAEKATALLLLMFDMTLEVRIVQIDFVFVPEMIEARPNPTIAPAQQIEREVGPGKGRRPKVAHNRLRLDEHRSTGPDNHQANINVIQIRKQQFIEHS